MKPMLVLLLGTTTWCLKHHVVVPLKHFAQTFDEEKMWTPCSCSLAKELHESTLHAQPAEARAVEQEGIEYQVERNPLKNRVIL